MNITITTILNLWSPLGLFRNFYGRNSGVRLLNGRRCQGVRRRRTILLLWLRSQRRSQRSLSIWSIKCLNLVHSHRECLSGGAPDICWHQTNALTHEGTCLPGGSNKIDCKACHKDPYNPVCWSAVGSGGNGDCEIDEPHCKYATGRTDDMSDEELAIAQASARLHGSTLELLRDPEAKYSKHHINWDDPKY
jgi:hypothetical protein